MRFTKMHGAGNDYVYVDGSKERVDDPAAVACVISDRHTGIGSDGLILILPPSRGVDADARMRMFNADGSEAQMCGNGIRCFCKYVHDHGLSRSNPMRIETGNGVLSLHYTTNGDGRVAQVTVDMGQPIFEPAKIPVNVASMTSRSERQTYTLALPDGGQNFTATFVSMGNPHAVIYGEIPAALDLQRLGPALEKHPAFPHRMNIHFVRVKSPGEVTVAHWERGSGATLACGTGACAVAVAGVLTGRTQRKLLAHLPGGDLQLHWREDNNHVEMTGPAVEVFSGEWPG